jgi:Asp-tRNA(Asn)/Glu-tRNA(Gln) amidotransferase A subunit family amidase
MPPERDKKKGKETMTDQQAPAGAYDPNTYKLLTFHDARQKFLEGTDTPRAYLERCLEQIEKLEPQVKAWAYLNTEPARKAADESTARYKAGKPLSVVDGMPLGIKDLFETADMPTEFNSDLFRGNQPIRDAAAVYFLRKGGAVMLGKTVTICLGGGDPAETRNPFDTRRTPGGSSSGSAAGVAARMIPSSLGTHGRGSTIRPSSFCGVYGIKPTFGSINRQGSFSAAHSMDHVGVLAGSFSDMWITARYAAKYAGGDPGHPGLYGSLTPPKPRKPARLIRLDMAGWAVADDEAKDQLERMIASLEKAGVEIYTRKDDPAIEAYEQALAKTPQLWAALYRFEMRWPLYQYRDHDVTKLPPRLLAGLSEGDRTSQESYRQALVDRDHLKAMHEELALRADGFITLSAPGAGPIGMDQGSAIFNEASSILGAPAISVPVLTSEKMPLGLQLLGPWHGDERLTAVARWIAEEHVRGS